MNTLNIALMILLNTALCLLLPRLITLDWTQVFKGNLSKG